MRKWIEQYNRVTDILSKHGWFIVPMMTGGEFAEIENLCKKIDEAIIPKSGINTEINKVITPIIFHPNYRAFTVFKFITLNHLNKYSHLIDRATFCYYKKDFLSAVSCLVPVVEGILLSHCGWVESSSKNKPNTKELIDKFCTVPNKTLNHHFRNVYSKALRECLVNWFFANTKQFDFSNSSLNRNYIAHSLGNKSFYSVLECNRMFTIMDLIAEIIVHDEFYNYVFIPENEPILNNRRDYYFDLIQGRISLNDIKKREYSFIIENKFYIPFENDINFHEIISDEMKRIAEFHKQIDQKIKVKKNRKSIFKRFFSQH